jgi:hypothetical protein
MFPLRPESNGEGSCYIAKGKLRDRASILNSAGLPQACRAIR